jgi:hypothetical protein
MSSVWSPRSVNSCCFKVMVNTLIKVVSFDSCNQVCSYEKSYNNIVPTLLTCTTPAVTVPSSLREYLDFATLEQDEESSKLGRVVDLKGNSIEIYYGILFNDNPNIYSIYQDFRSLNNDVTTVLTAGPKIVQWDDVYDHQRGVDSWKPIEVCPLIHQFE